MKVGITKEKDYGYEYPIKGTRFGFTISLRKMRSDEMPINGKVYYCDIDGTIYEEGEKELLINK